MLDVIVHVIDIRTEDSFVQPSINEESQRTERYSSVLQPVGFASQRQQLIDEMEIVQNQRVLLVDCFFLL